MSGWQSEAVATRALACFGRSGVRDFRRLSQAVCWVHGMVTIFLSTSTITILLYCPKTYLNKSKQVEQVSKERLEESVSEPNSQSIRKPVSQ